MYNATFTLSAFKYAQHSVFSIPMQLGAASHNAPHKNETLALTLSFNRTQTVKTHGPREFTRTAHENYSLNLPEPGRAYFYFT